MALSVKDALEAAFQELQVQYKVQYLHIPCLLGGTGAGKTEGGAGLCLRMCPVVEDEIIFTPIPVGEAADPTETIGIPWVISVDCGPNNSKEYRVLWALNNAAFQACHAPTMLLFDDIDKASPMVVNALLHLFVHRAFKDFRLHPKSLMMCAGNRTGDDIHANALSESIKTRVTIIELEPTLNDFIEWATADGQQLIHPMFLAFLPSKPELLHKHEEGVWRFPTPRGWREASLFMEVFRNPKDWKGMWERKLGVGVANDLWVFYTIISRIDVDYILAHGKLKEPIVGSSKMPAEVAAKMGEFAAVFAVVDRLNQGVKPGHAGLEDFIDSLSPELRVAFLLQLKESAKKDFVRYYPKAAGQIMGGIVKDSA